jgi:hypothetical protein
MKSSDLSQVVVSPADSTDELLAAINEAIDTNAMNVHFSKRTMLRLLLADLVHPIGIHHWVAYRTFDSRSNRIIVHPNTWVCAKCPEGRIG